MTQSTITAHRFFHILEDGCHLKQLSMEIIDALGKPILGEPVEDMQKKLDAALVGHSTRLQKDFTHRYPKVDLTALWESMGERHSKLRTLRVQDKWAADFVNVTLWSVLQEGGRRGTDAQPLTRLSAFLNWTVEETRAAVRPVQFASICGVCGSEVTVNAHSASLKRSILNAVMACPHCSHVEHVARTTISRSHVPLANFEPRLNCSCSRCVGIRESVRDRASQVASHVDAGVSSMAQWMRENSKELIPIQTENPIEEEGLIEMRCIERELVESACTLDEAVARRCQSRGFSANLSHIADTIGRGISYGYLRVSNIRMNRSKQLIKDCRDGVDRCEEWGGEYSLGAYIADLASADFYRIIHGCAKMHVAQNIESPVMADISYVGDVQGSLRAIAREVLQLAAQIESGIADPAVQVQSLKGIHQRLIQMA
jgi:hypothetical protein